MPAPRSLADRVVEVEGYDGRNYHYGTGLIFDSRTLLTALHVIDGCQSITLRAEGQTEYQATIEPPTAYMDMAIVDIVDHADVADELPASRLAIIDRESSTPDVLRDCQLYGYPVGAETRSATGGLIRRRFHSPGFVPIHDGAPSDSFLISLERGALRTTAGTSPWRGLSGAPLFHRSRLIGIVVEDPNNDDGTSLRFIGFDGLANAIRRDPADRDPEALVFASRLGLSADVEPENIYGPVHQLGTGIRSTAKNMVAATRFTGREAELQLLSDFVADNDSRYLWLAGPAYAGKTTLLAKFVADVLPDDVRVFGDFLNPGRFGVSGRQFEERLKSQLRGFIESATRDPIDNESSLNDLWTRASRIVADQDWHLLLIVDGLDEDDRRGQPHSVASMLPDIVARNTHLIVSSRDTEVTQLKDEPLRLHGLAKTAPTDLELLPDNLEAESLLREEMGTVERANSVYRRLLRTLSVARGSLTIEDLAQICHADFHAVHDFLISAERLLVPRRILGVEHYHLIRSDLQPEPSSVPDAVDDIRRWAATWRRRGWPDDTPRYLFASYPSMLVSAESAELYEDVGWVARGLHVVGVDVLLAHLQTALDDREDDSYLRSLTRVLTHSSPPLRRLPSWDDPHERALFHLLLLSALELSEEELAARFLDRLPPARLPRPQTMTRQPTVAALAEASTRLRPSAACCLPTGSGNEESSSPEPANDHERVLLGDPDGSLHLWDPDQPDAEPALLARRRQPIVAVAPLGPGRCVTAHLDGTVVAWRLDGLTAIIEGAHRLNHLAPSFVAPFGDDEVLVAGEYGNISLLRRDPDGDLSERTTTRTRDSTANAYALGGPNVLLTGGSDGRVKRWTETGGQWHHRVVAEFDSPIVAIDSSTGGDTVLVANTAGELAILIADSDEPIVLGRHFPGVAQAKLLPSSTAVSLATDGSIRTWPLNRGRGQDVLLSGQTDSATMMAVGCGRHVTRVQRNGRITLLEPSLASVRGPGVTVAPRRVRSVGFLDSNTVVALDDESNRPLLWSATEGRFNELEVDSASTLDIASIVPMGPSSLAVIDRGHRVWSSAVLADEMRLAVNHGPLETPGSKYAVPLADGRLLVGGPSTDLATVDLAAEKVRPFARHDGLVSALTSNAALELVCSGDSTGHVRVWDLAEEVPEIVTDTTFDSGVAAIAVIGRGSYLVGTDDGAISLLDDGGQTQRVGHHSWMDGLLPWKGRVALSYSGDQGVVVWDIDRGTQSEFRFRAVAGAVTGPRQDGTRSISLADSTGRLSLWQ